MKKVSSSAALGSLVLSASLSFSQFLKPDRPCHVPNGKVIRCQRMKTGLTVALANESGKFTAGKNVFCTWFQKSGTTIPAEVNDVSVDFILLVGRTQTTIPGELVRDQVGPFCGVVDLGRQYYFPSSYYVLTSFKDDTGKRRKMRFSIVVK